MYLSVKENPFKSVLSAFEKAFKKLYKQKNYLPEDIIKIPEYKNAVEQTYKVFNTIIEDAVVEGELLRKLQEDVFLFSGLKTHAQLLEASRLLLDNNGKIKPEHLFKKEFQKINTTYNETYLETEYDFAIASAQQADRWSKIDPDYYLQYRTASDDRVRDSHKALHSITLAANDPFWSSFYPPNGWRCRCVATEVRPEKYKTSDSNQAIEKGEIATTQIDKNNKNKLAIFRFNPGKDQILFPPDHPYQKLKGSKTVKKKILNTPRILKTNKEVSEYFKQFAIQYPEYFANGYDKVKVTRKRGVNGYTTLKGDIYLTSSVMENVKAGLNTIFKKEKTTKDQEIAISTLHHEIMHNAHTRELKRLTSVQVRYMELANEFVSRKELPIFMKRLGGKLEHNELTKNRENTTHWLTS